MGGAGEIKRLYKYLFASYDDFKREMVGKIYLLSDTDSQLVQYEVTNESNLLCNRIVSGSNYITDLVNINSSHVSPSTTIEDVLNGKAFVETLVTFRDDYPEHLGFLDSHSMEDVKEVCSRSALDLKTSETDKLLNFFKQEGVKYEFSKRYIDIIDDSYEIPDWITKIRQYFES